MEGKNKDNLPSNSLDASSTSSSPDNAVRVDDNKNLFTVEERQNTSDEQVLKPFTEITSSNDCPGGLAVRVATTILQPICLGDGPFMLPIHLHTSQVSQAGGSPYLTANPSPVSLPLLLEQQVFQHLSPFTLHQGDLGASMSLQNNIPCHNSPLSMKQIIPPFDQTSSGSLQEPRTMPFLKGPDFAAVLQDPFSNQSSHYTTFQQRTSSPANSFSHLAPSHTYPSTLSSLVPPPTLMVPYPVVIPLPVPLPIPIPFPIPVPQNGHLKDLTNPTKPKCHLDKTTQTAFQENCSQPQVISLSDTNAEALDLSVKTLQVLPKPEAIVQQDRALDLSLASTRKPYYGEHHSQKDQQGSSLSLEILQPMEYAQNIDSQILNSLASLEFNQQHKWMLDSSKSESSCEIVTTSQTAKVIVAVKDAVPAIFCGKLKDLSGMSTKNFSFKRDACQEVTLQQCYSIKAQSEDRNHDNLHKKPSRNKSNQLRKAGSREVHILPIKKQRLDFFPRE